MYFTFTNGKVEIAKSTETKARVRTVSTHSDPFSYAKRSVWLEETDTITPNANQQAPIGRDVSKSKDPDSGISSLSTSPELGWNWNNWDNWNQSAFCASHSTLNGNLTQQQNMNIWSSILYPGMQPDTELLSWYSAYKTYAKSWMQYQIGKREMEDEQKQSEINSVKRTLVHGKNLPPRLAAKFAQENEMRCSNDIYHRKPLCAFCRRNGEPRNFYENHRLKNEQGVVTCPILRAFKCPICAATGDNAHTESYCPSKQSAKLPGSCVRIGRDSIGRYRQKPNW